MQSTSPSLFSPHTVRRRTAVAILATMISVPKLRAASGDWNVDANTGWSTATNWVGGIIPDAIDDTANFGFNISAGRTINLDGSRTLGTMTVGDSASSFFGYNFGFTTTSDVLTFDTSSGNANLTFTATSTAGSAFNVPIKLNDTLNIHALNAGSSTFSGSISGTGGLIVDSSGTHDSATSSLVGQIALNAINTFSGGLSITGARVSAAMPASLSTGPVTVNDSGQLLLTGNGTYSNNFILNGLGWNEPTELQLGAIRTNAGSFNFTGATTLASTSRLVGLSNSFTIFNGAIGETAGGAKNLEINRLQTGGAAANGTFVFNNSNTYTGKTTVYSGTLRIGNRSTTGTLGNTSGLEFANANIEFRRSDNLTVTTSFTQLTGTIGGVAVTGSNLIQSGTGTLTLDNGSSAYTGTTTVNGFNGKLIFGTGGAYNFTGTGTISLSNGADLEFNTSSAVNVGTVTLAAADAGRSFLMQSGSGTTTLAGTADNAFAGAIVNSGTLVLGKTSTASVHAIGSNLIVNGGTLRLGGSGGDQIFSSADVQVNGGSFDLNGMSEGIDVLAGTGGTITNTVAASTGTLTVGQNNSAINGIGLNVYTPNFAGVIQDGAGVVAVTKAGTGSQTLSGTNTYSGATTISAGVLSVTGSTLSTGAVAVNNGGTLSGTGSLGNVTLAIGGSIRPGATSVDASAGTLTLNSLTVNGGDLRLNLGSTSDRVNVTGLASFTASSTITPTFSSLPATGTSTVLLSAPGGLALTTTPTLTGVPASTRSSFSLNTTANTIELAVSGASAKSLTWTGVTSGAWDLATTSNFDAGGAETFWNLDGVTFGDGPTNRTVTLAAGLVPTSITVNNSPGNDYTFQTGNIAGAGGLTKSGNGALILSDTANTYTGATIINGGTLSIGNGGTTGSIAGTSPVTVNAAGTLKWSNANSTTIVTITNPVSGTGTVLLQGQNDVTALQKSLYDLNGDSSGFSGTLQLNRAILTNVAGPSELGSATIELQDRGTIFITNGNTYANNFIVNQGAGWHHNVSTADVVLGAIRLQGTNILTGNITLNNTASIVIGDGTGANSTIGAYTTSDDSLTGVISGAGDFAMSRYTSYNGGTAQDVNIRLGGSSSNTYTGKTVVDGQGAKASLWLEKTGGAVAIPGNTVVQFGSGTNGQANLRMGQNEQFGPGVVLNWVNASGQWGRFDLKGTTQTIAGANSGTATTQGNGIIQNQGIDVVVPDGDATLTFNGVGTYLFNGYIRDQDNAGTARKINIVKSGTGTQTLVGNQITYTGTTTVNDGILRLENTSAFNSNIDNGATVELSAPTGINFAFGAAKIWSGNGTWTKIGDGRVRLNNTIMNVSGNIVVQAGTFGNDFNACNWTGSTANLSVAAGATFDIRADSVRLNSLNGAGSLINSYGIGNGQYDTLTVGVVGGSGTFNGAITDGGTGVGEGRGGLAFTKQGTGAQILTGNNTYAGVTTIGGGTLQVGDGGTTGNLGTNSVVNNGTLIFNRSNNHAMNAAISGTGAFVKAGAGTMVLNSQSNYTGATTISGGTLQLGASSSLPVSAAIWLDATDGTTINTTAGAITSWTNKGTLGASGDAAALTGEEPSFVAAEPAMNNRPVIHFDAGDTGLAPFDRLTNNTDFSASNVTVIYAGRLTGGANFRMVSGAGNNWLLGTHGGLSDRAHLGNSSAFVDQGGVTANTNAHIYASTNTTTGSAAFYADTLLRGSNTSANYLGPKGISLGGGFFNSVTGSATTEFSDCDLGEVLVFNSNLTEDERRSVEAYLSRKWKGIGTTDVLPTTTALSLTAAGATLDVNGVTQTVGSISGVNGTNISLGGGTLTTGGNNASTAFDGVFTGAGSIHKAGTGTWTLGGASTNTGSVFVDGGTLLVNGSLSGSIVTIGSGATLGGSGTITGNVTALTGAILAPGTSLGQLDTNDFTLSNGSTLSLEIGGLIAGTSYDQLNVSGSLTLGGDLALQLTNGFVPQPGQRFWITLNDGSDAANGIFANVPITDIPQNSGTLNSGGYGWIVSYGADFGSGGNTGGNDILLTVVPEPNSITALIFGLGAVAALRRQRRSPQL